MIYLEEFACCQRLLAWSSGDKIGTKVNSLFLRVDRFKKRKKQICGSVMQGKMMRIGEHGVVSRRWSSRVEEIGRWSGKWVEKDGGIFQKQIYKN